MHGNGGSAWTPCRSDRHETGGRVRGLRGICVAVLLWCVASLVPASGADVRQEALPLLPQARMVEDPQGTLIAADVQQLPEAAWGMPPPGAVVNFGFGKSAYWFSVALDNPGSVPLPRLLVFEPIWLDDVQAVLIRPDCSRVEFRGGDRLAFAQRAEPLRQINADFVLPPGQSRLLVRVATRDPFLFGMTLWDHEAFLRTESADAAYFGLVYGAAGALLIFNLILFFSVRDRVYAAYVVYLGVFIVMHANYNGLLFHFAWPESPRWGNWAHAVFIYLFLLAGLTFAVQFLELRKRLPRAYRWARNLAGLALATAFGTALIGGYPLQVLSSILWVMVSAPFSLLLGVVSLRAGNRVSRYFLLATAAGFAGSFVTAAAVGGFLPISTYSFRAVDVGMLIDAVLLSFALADRLRLSRLAADSAKSELIAATRRYAGQLEETVADRTRALSAANASLERALADLKEGALAKSRFFAAASHDLRQPIHALVLFLDALNDARQEDERRKLMNSMATALNSLGELLNTLLDISKLDAGAIVPRPETVHAEDLFAEIADGFEPLAREKHLAFRLWLPQRPICLQTDRRLLLSVVGNIVGNALKHTRRGGVLVALRRRAGGLVLQVWDSGMGIAPEHLERIFDEYYQIDNPQRDRSQGMGLGLAIARRICALLGFTLACRSRPGRGSLFEIFLPLAATCSGAPADAAPLAPVSAQVGRFAGKRFALLEDDALVADALRDFLTLHGIAVTVAGNAEAALADPSILAADYFVVDHQLGGTQDGFGFLAALQARTGRKPRAVILSGNTSAAFIAAAQACGCPYLFKPAHVQSILMALAATEPAAAGAA